jgi:preprotein translocase subunit SecE
MRNKEVKKLKKIVNFLKEVKAETQKVDWPSKPELINSLILVVVISTVVALFFFGIDWLFFMGVDKTLTYAGSI